MTLTSTSTATAAPGAFVTVPGDRHSEVARTLAEPVPQALSALDQLGLWGNLGVSLLGFTGAIFVLQPGGTGTPELSLAAALTAIVLGTVLGTLPVALAGLPGARTGRRPWCCCAACSGPGCPTCRPRSTSCSASAGASSSWSRSRPRRTPWPRRCPAGATC